jgi:flagellar basal-body rod protein FlgC
MSGGEYMSLFQSFDISASGMTAERFRTDIIAENIANINTTNNGDGEPYRRKVVTFQQKTITPFSQYFTESRNAHVGNGVKVSQVTEDYTTEFVMTYDPANPDADENGYVSYPNVNTVTEMTNLIDATRAYEANANAFDASKSMAKTGLSIGQ